jgi:hypothetical protein
MSDFHHGSLAKEDDLEKGSPAAIRLARSPSVAVPPASSISPKPSRLARFLSPAIFEERGIERVLPSETGPFDWRAGLQTVLLWVSVNLAAVCITLGMLGPTIFELGFVDSCLCAVLGSFLGSLGVCYMITWGPKGGMRAMVSISLSHGMHTVLNASRCSLASHSGGTRRSSWCYSS